jgi:thiamine-phosphate pyrophosphorylase
MTLPPLYPILDTGALARRGISATGAAAQWLDAGARIIQIRHKGHWSRGAFAEAKAIAALCRDHDAQCIVDDRADLALLLQTGLHVGQDDLPPADARRILGPDAIIGFSSHNPEQLCAAAAEPVDYVALGPVFATASKDNPDPVVGVDQVRRCRALVSKPLVAIGGITRQNARDVLAAGADSVAIIADLLPEPCTIESLRARMTEWLQLIGM